MRTANVADGSHSAGRYYAAVVQKLILAHVLMNYDCELADETEPRSMWWRTSITPLSKTTMIFRSRTAPWVKSIFLRLTRLMDWEQWREFSSQEKNKLKKKKKTAPGDGETLEFAVRSIGFWEKVKYTVVSCAWIFLSFEPYSVGNTGINLVFVSLCSTFLSLRRFISSLFAFAFDFLFLSPPLLFSFLTMTWIFFGTPAGGWRFLLYRV